MTKKDRCMAARHVSEQELLGCFAANKKAAAFGAYIRCNVLEYYENSASESVSAFLSKPF
jgi:hypothetical protein